MKLVGFNCPNCGGNVPYSGSGDTVDCEYCGTTLYVQYELDKKQTENASAIMDITNRIYDLIRQGEFVKAESAAENALQTYPYSGLLHLCLLMSELNVVKPSLLGNYGKDYTKSKNFQNCIRYMTTQDKTDLLSLVEKNRNAMKERNSASAASSSSADFDAAIFSEEPEKEANDIVTETLKESVRKEKIKVVNQKVSEKVNISEDVLDTYFEQAYEECKQDMRSISSVDEIDEKFPAISKKMVNRYLEFINLHRKQGPLTFPPKDKTVKSEVKPQIQNNVVKGNNEVYQSDYDQRAVDNTIVIGGVTPRTGGNAGVSQNAILNGGAMPRTSLSPESTPVKGASYGAVQRPFENGRNIYPNNTDEYDELVDYETVEEKNGSKGNGYMPRYESSNEQQPQAEATDSGKKLNRTTKFIIIASSIILSVFLLLVIMAAAVKHPIINKILFVTGIIDLAAAFVLFKIVDYREKFICPNCGAKRIHHRQYLRTVSKQVSNSKIEYKHQYYDTYTCPECGKTYSCHVTKSGGYEDSSGDHTIEPREF